MDVTKDPGRGVASARVCLTDRRSLRRRIAARFRCAVGLCSATAVILLGACGAADVRAAQAADVIADAEWVATAAVVVRDEAGEGTTAAENDRTPMRGGSTAKLLTAAVALEVLGPDFPLTTGLVSTSPGSLTLTGGWDPLLRRDDLTALARDAAQDAIGRDGATVSVSAATRSAEAIDRPRDWPEALVPVIEPAALMLTDDRAVLRGEAVATRLVEELENEGVPAVVTSAPAAEEGGARVVAAVSHTVAEAVERMLADSDSLIAEALFGRVAREVGAQRDWGRAGERAAAVLAEAGVDARGVTIADGSGTSEQNRLTARAVSDVLVLARQDPAWSSLAQGLPVAGRTGTLSSEAGRFASGPQACAAGHVRAKTGTLSGVAALSGYAEADEGVDVFSIILNGISPGVPEATQKEVLDRAAATLVGCLPPS